MTEEGPRLVELTPAQVHGMTVLESARALALAGVSQRDAERLLRTFARADADPAQLLAAAELLYAIAYQVVHRHEPSVSWEEAQGWRVVLDLEAGVDELAEAEAAASVDAAIVTGLPPAVAGELTMSQLERYRELAAERTKRARRGRRAG
jgi:hypothetical protein